MTPDIKLNRLPRTTIDMPGDVYPGHRTHLPKDPYSLLNLKDTEGVVAAHGDFINQLAAKILQSYPHLSDKFGILSPWPFGARCASIPFHNDGKVVDTFLTQVNDADIFFVAPITQTQFSEIINNMPLPRNVSLARHHSAWSSGYYSTQTHTLGGSYSLTDIHHLPLPFDLHAQHQLKTQYFPYHSDRFGHPVLLSQFDSQGQLSHKIWQPYPLNPDSNEVHLYNAPQQADSIRVYLTALRYLLWVCRASAITSKPASVNQNDLEILRQGMSSFRSQLTPQDKRDISDRYQACWHLVTSLGEFIRDSSNFSHSHESRIEVADDMYEPESEEHVKVMERLSTSKYTASRYENLHQKYGYNPEVWFKSMITNLGFSDLIFIL